MEEEGEAYDTSTKQVKRRRRNGPKAKKACEECRQAHTFCGNERPCARCKSRGTECIDSPGSATTTSTLPSKRPRETSPPPPPPPLQSQHQPSNLPIALPPPTLQHQTQNPALEKHLLDIILANFSGQTTQQSIASSSSTSFFPHEHQQFHVQSHLPNLPQHSLLDPATPFLPELDMPVNTNSSFNLQMSAHAGHSNQNHFSAQQQAVDTFSAQAALIQQLQAQVLNLTQELSTVKNIMYEQKSIMSQIALESVVDSQTGISFWDRRTMTLIYCNDKFISIFGPDIETSKIQIGKTRLFDLCEIFRLSDLRTTVKLLIERLVDSDGAGKEPEVHKYYDRAVIQRTPSVLLLDELAANVKKDYCSLQVSLHFVPVPGASEASTATSDPTFERRVLYHEFKFDDEEVQKEYEDSYHGMRSELLRFFNVLTYLEQKKLLNKLQFAPG